MSESILAAETNNSNPVAGQSAPKHKKDLIIAVIIGFFCAVFILPIIKNLKISIPFDWGLIFVLPVLSLGGMWIAQRLVGKIKVILQIARFVLVGALNTFVDWGVLNLLMFLTATASGSFFTFYKALSFLAATVNSYFWNKLWTFKKETAGESVDAGREFLQFFWVSLIGFALNVGVATIIVNIIGAPANIAEALWANFGAFCGTLTGLVWNFLGYKLIVFKS